MTVGALHPEELLDRERRGALTPGEREALAAHCAGCAACRLQRSLSHGAEQGESDPSSRALAARAAEGAIARLLEERPGRARPARHRLLAMAAGLAIALVGGVATATWLALRGGDRAEPAPAVVPSLPSARPVGAGAPASSDPAPEADPLPDLRAPAPETDRPSETASAAALFAEANRLRRRGAASEAVRAYQELQRRYPVAQEALLSRVVLGRLYLDRRGEPLRALRQFDAYLADTHNVALREEALIGRGLALGRLGNRGEERRAWQALLAAFPDSMYSEKARARLSELEPRP